MSAHQLREQPIEFDFANDAFALVPEETEDGARIQREHDEAERTKQAQDKAQLRLVIDPASKQTKM